MWLERLLIRGRQGKNVAIKEREISYGFVGYFFNTAVVGYSGRKSVQNFPHQFGLIDALCGLYFPFRDEYDILITYPSTSNSLDGYKPDAIVKYRHKLDGREYDFILEFERTRTPRAIFEEKIRLNEKITNFRKYGLSK